MATLTVTSKGQVTLRKELLHHLGVHAGDKIEVDLLPGNKLQVQPARRTKSWEKVRAEFRRILEGKAHKPATLEEIEQAVQDGWAGRVDMGE